MASVYERYELGDSIASGGMGEILLARDIELNRDVALKRMLFIPNEGDGPEAVRYFERFLEEAQITAQLDHPSIVPIHSIGFDDKGRAYYTMRLVKGRELGEIFQLSQDGHPGWNQARIIGVLVKVCQAVAFAHSKGIAHRDLKPSNIMVGSLGEVYVMDWGLATAFESLRREALRQHQSAMGTGVQTIAIARELTDNPDRSQTRLGSIVGTPAYLAPELATGAERSVDPRGDVYALGAVLYELLAGHAPYMESGQATTAESVVDALRSDSPKPLPKGGVVSPELTAICEQAMARDRACRYSNCEELAEELQAYLDGRIVQAYESGTFARVKKWVLRNRVLTAAMLMTFFAVVAVAWISTWSSVRLARSLDETETEKARTVEVLAESFFRQGMLYFDQHELRLAMANWAQALRHDPDHYPAAARIAASCLQERIPLPVSLPLRGDGRFSGLAASPAGPYLALTENGERVRLWHVEKQAWQWSWNFDRVPRRMAFSPDGTLLVAFVVYNQWTSGEIHWFDTESGERPISKMHIPECVTGIRASFSDDGRLMAAVGRVWALDNRELLMAPQPKSIVDGFDEYGTRTALSRDGRWLALGASDGMVFVFDVEKKVETSRIKLGNPQKQISELEWNEDGSLLLCSFLNGQVVLVDRDRIESREIPLPPDSPSRAVLFTGPGRVLSASEDGFLRVWDANSGEMVLPSMPSLASVRQLVMDEDRARLLSVGSDENLRVWDLQSGQALCEPIPYCVYGAFVGERVFSLNTDGSVEEWRLPKDVALPIQHEVVPQFSHQFAALTPNGAKIIGPGGRGIDSMTGQLLFSQPREEAISKTSVAISPDSKQFVIALGNSNLSLRSALTGKVILALAHGPDRVKGVAFSHSGGKFVAWSDDTICVWATQKLDQRPLQLHRPHGLGNPVRFQFDAEERRLSLSSWRGGLFAWDLETGKEIAQTLAGPLSIYSNFQPDDHLLALVGKDSFRVWDDELDDFRKGIEFEHSLTIVSAAFSGDGRFVATGSHDSTAKIWNLKTGALVGTVLDHSGPVYFVDFERNGDRLIASSAGGTVDIWDRARSVRLIDSIRLRGDEARFAQFTEEGNRLLVLSGASYSMWDIPPNRRIVVPEWWPAFAESLAGVHIRQTVDGDGIDRIHTEPSPRSDRHALWARLRESNQADGYTQIAKWFLAEPETRAPSPFRSRSRVVVE